MRPTLILRIFIQNDESFDFFNKKKVSKIDDPIINFLRLTLMAPITGKYVVRIFIQKCVKQTSQTRELLAHAHHHQLLRVFLHADFYTLSMHGFTASGSAE